MVLKNQNQKILKIYITKIFGFVEKTSDPNSVIYFLTKTFDNCLGIFVSKPQI